MDKETILAKSRQENKEKDLYELSIETKAYRVAFTAAEIIAAFLFCLDMILTGEYNYSLLIVEVTAEAVFNFYIAIKLKTSKAFVKAIFLTILDAVLTSLIVLG